MSSEPSRQREEDDGYSYRVFRVGNADVVRYDPELWSVGSNLYFDDPRDAILIHQCRGPIPTWDRLLTRQLNLTSEASSSSTAHKSNGSEDTVKSEASVNSREPEDSEVTLGSQSTDNENESRSDDDSDDSDSSWWYESEDNDFEENENLNIEKDNRKKMPTKTAPLSRPYLCRSSGRQWNRPVIKRQVRKRRREHLQFQRQYT